MRGDPLNVKEHVSSLTNSVTVSHNEIFILKEDETGGFGGFQGGRGGGFGRAVVFLSESEK